MVSEAPSCTLDASGVGPTSYVAIGRPDGREYWPAEVMSGGDNRGSVARDTSSGRWLQYRDICGDYDDEVFRDGLGWV